MDALKVKELVGNKIFTAWFIKKNGDVRKINCRLGVKKHLKGGTKPYKDSDHDLLTVFDMQKGAYRSINLNTLQSIAVNGKILFKDSDTREFSDVRFYIKGNAYKDKVLDCPINRELYKNKYVENSGELYING